jgi:rhodanese-related sulfurtransferase
VELAQEVVPKNKEVILICESGGSLENKAGGGNFGSQSRSLKAAYFLVRDGGFTKVSYCTGGFPEWCRADLPVAALE